jgi:hypothetical protein
MLSDSDFEKPLTRKWVTTMHMRNDHGYYAYEK